MGMGLNLTPIHQSQNPNDQGYPGMECSAFLSVYRVRGCSVLSINREKL